MKRALWITLALIVFGLLLWQFLRPPDPSVILAEIEIPDTPVLSAEEERSTFRLAPGFRAELVAAEPLVVDPVAMDWDDESRLYVVEMRGFMPDIEGKGEDQPSGRVVILEDLDGDGRMDQSHVFLDGLVLPRAIAVLPEGVLIGVPPNLLLCSDRNEDLRCGEDELSRELDYAADSGNVEHRENALLPGLDGWLYNSKSDRRFRFHSERLEVDSTIFRGQWGIAQDDLGRLYYNHNSGFLYADFFPGEYALRQPATAAALSKPGLNVDLASGEKVWGVRVAPGLNRAYLPGTLRRDGRQNGPTGISGLVIQRGNQYGKKYIGDAFVPESAGSAVAHFSISDAADGVGLVAEHRLYPDEDYGKREFLASTDERFRPVDVKVGPDGAVWVIDMYRGVIQHAHYVSDHLRDYVARQGLAPPGATGRLWRIVREDQPIDYTPPRLDDLEDQIEGLAHPNAWVRDRAQRRLIHEGPEAAIERLRRLKDLGPTAGSHALRVLDALGELDLATWRTASASKDSQVRQLALQLGERIPSRWRPGPERTRITRSVRDAALEAQSDPDPRVALQAIHTLGSLPLDARPLETLLERIADEDELIRQAGLSGLAGLEERALDHLLANADGDDEKSIREVTTAAFAHAQSHADPEERVARLLDRVAEAQGETGNADLALALVEGIERAQALPHAQRVVLHEAHPLFTDELSPAHRDSVARIRRGFTWEGDPTPGGARALDAEEERLRTEGAELFAATCATCHGLEGRGIAGLAPPLAGSEWVRDANAWLIRIALHGIRGPLQVRGQQWNSIMPGHGHDPRFDDEGLAGLFTFLRRAWGHGDEPIPRDQIAAVRRATAQRATPWTAEELLALPIEHRLDRYVGIYRIPIVGIELSVTRAGSQLEIGRSTGPRAAMEEIGDGVFSGEGMQIRFDPTLPGKAAKAQVQFGSDSVEVSRANP